MGGGDDAHVGLDWRTSADGCIFALLQHAQKTRLCLKRHVADFVKEKRSAFGLARSGLAFSSARRCAAAQAGKHVFCEKPMALTLEDADRAIDAARTAGVALQVGFNRRFAADFAAMRARIDAGEIGTPQLLRSLTRDPGISAEVAARVKPWTIFNETLIHDFDTLCWLNPGARVTEVYAQADALVHPQFAEQGFLDTSVVQIRFDNGAFAIAEASFQAVYGYDIRGEVFGSGGVLQAGLRPRARRPASTPNCSPMPTPRSSPISPTMCWRARAVRDRCRRPHRARNRPGGT